jgi:predicted RNase H-like nuclease
MSIKLIGIDCATQPQNTGLSLGVYENGQLKQLETKLGEHPIAELVYAWVTGLEKVLIAIDAPLGWPMDMGQALGQHEAGQVIDSEPNILFSRETDRFIRSNLGLIPLFVGADRIARTAHAALKMIDELRQLTHRTIELVWDNNISDISVIEVYPAATLKANGMPHVGYKKPEQRNVRETIISGLQQYMMLRNAELLKDNADALDSAVCLLAAKDFLEGKSYQPINIDKAKKEGWIWVREV